MYPKSFTLSGVSLETYSRVWNTLYLRTKFGVYCYILHGGLRWDIQGLTLIGKCIDEIETN